MEQATGGCQHVSTALPPHLELRRRLMLQQQAAQSGGQAWHLAQLPCKLLSFGQRAGLPPSLQERAKQLELICPRHTLQAGGSRASGSGNQPDDKRH